VRSNARGIRWRTCSSEVLHRVDKHRPFRHPAAQPSAATIGSAPVEILSRGNSVEIAAACTKQSENKFFRIGI
jgi:hypothetical protein